MMKADFTFLIKPEPRRRLRLLGGEEHQTRLGTHDSAYISYMSIAAAGPSA
jgi:hypothetical protein